MTKSSIANQSPPRVTPIDAGGLASSDGAYDAVGVLRKGLLVAEGAPAELVRALGAPNLARAVLALRSEWTVAPGGRPA